MTLSARGTRDGCHNGSSPCNVRAQDLLQTTWILVKVLYPVEQLSYCDLLRLGLWSEGLFLFYFFSDLYFFWQKTGVLQFWPFSWTCIFFEKKPEFTTKTVFLRLSWTCFFFRKKPEFTTKTVFLRFLFFSIVWISPYKISSLPHITHVLFRSWPSLKSWIQSESVPSRFEREREMTGTSSIVVHLLARKLSKISSLSGSQIQFNFI